MENPTESGKGASQLTEAQQELRPTGIGASEIAAVCGVDPYRNDLDVFLEKTGQVEPFAGNEFTEWGNRLEDAIAIGYADRMGVVLRRSDTITLADAPWMFCTPDRMVVDAFRGVECKNRNYFNFGEWGEPGTDEIPLEVVAQVQWSMRVTGLPRWDVAVLLGGNRLGIYHVEYDEELAESMVKQAHTFWHDFVLPRITPALDGSDSASRYLNKKWWLYEEALKEPSPEVLENALALRVVRASLAEGEADKKVLENLIKDFIADSLGIQLPGDQGKITWRRPKSSQKTNWQMVAEGLKRGRHVMYAKLIETHTEEKEATRRFLPQFK